MTPEEKIPKEATLFHLGLDSISAIKSIFHVEEAVNQLPVGEMIKAGSIRNMLK